MKKLILGTLLAVATLCAGGFGSASTDEDILLSNPFTGGTSKYLIGTASETGSYHKGGTKLANSLKDAYAATTDGSGQNLELLEKGIINVAFVQGDIYNLWKSKNPALAENFTVIVTERTEHVHMIMRKGDSEDKLQQKGSKVIVGLQKSGGAGSWRNMQLLEPGYIAEPIFSDIDRIALNELKNKKVDAIIRTAHVKPGDAFINSVLAESGLEVVDLDDMDLNDATTLNGVTAPIYNFTKVQLNDKFISNYAKVLETKVYVVISNDKTSRKQRSEIANVIADYKATLFN